MSAEVLSNVSGGVLGDVFLQLGTIGKWIQAIGLLVVLWIVFHVITLIMNRKKRKAIYSLVEKTDRIEKKVDMLISMQKKKVTR